MTQKYAGAPAGGQVIDCAVAFTNDVGESKRREGLSLAAWSHCRTMPGCASGRLWR